MEQRYNIQFNRTPPAPHQVKAFQNFEQLLKDSENPHAPTKKKNKVVGMRSRTAYLTYFISSAAAVALLVFGWLQWQASTATPVFTDQQIGAYFAERPFILPPSTANVPDVKMASIEKTEEDQKIALDDGQVVVSRTTLFRDRGRAIQQPVQLHYRQMDEVADYFLAGLPLAYTEAGQNTQLDAAVVLDVYATAAGQPIPIAAGEQVEVQLNTRVYTDNEQADYALYRLDTVARRWEKVAAVGSTYQDIDWPQDWPSVQAYRQLEASYADKIRRASEASELLPPSAPQAPKKKLGNKPTIELDFLNGLALTEDSELKAEDLERLNSRGIWELLPETGQIDMRAFNVVWEQVRLRHLAGGDRYELTLINPQRQEKLIVQPILLDNTNYQAAMQRYEADLANYQAALAEYEEQTKQNNQLIIEERDLALADAKAAILQEVAQLPLEKQIKYQQQQVNFRFSISSWGLYAVARSLQELAPLTEVNYRGERNKPQSKQFVYVADKRYKTIYRSLKQGEKQSLPISKTTKIWLVDEQGDLYRSTSQQNNSALKTIQIEALGPLAPSASLVKQQLGLE